MTIWWPCKLRDLKSQVTIDFHMSYSTMLARRQCLLYKLGKSKNSSFPGIYSH